MLLKVYAVNCSKTKQSKTKKQNKQTTKAILKNKVKIVQV